MSDVPTAAVVITALPNGTFSVLDADGELHPARTPAALGRLCARLVGAPVRERKPGTDKHGTDKHGTDRHGTDNPEPEDGTRDEADVHMDPKLAAVTLGATVAVAAAKAGVGKFREMQEQHAAEKAAAAERARMRRVAKREDKLKNLNAAERRRFLRREAEPEAAPRISSLRKPKSKPKSKASA